MINKDYPLVDLHRHLDGNINIDTIIDLSRQYNVSLPEYERELLRPFVQVSGVENDLIEFLKKLDVGVSVLGGPEACQRVAMENVKSVYDAGLDYAELRFSPGYMAKSHNLPLPAVVEAVIEGVKEGMSKYPVTIKLIGIMSRTWGTAFCKAELDALVPYRENIVAIDLAGDECRYPCREFVEHFVIARDHGFRITVHAGEASGPQSIKDAIILLGAERIGHGVQAIKDDALMDYMANNQIVLECCLTSNIQTSTVSRFAEHPVKHFLQRGMMVTLNTDDPAVQGIDIQHEYNTAARLAGLTKDDLLQMQLNGFAAAFLSDAERMIILARKLQHQSGHADGAE
ncbi:TPA: adenosine deaminase [Klebsiella quasipneumoniae subsp. similipneumoniae]|nr:adenosine deaminase [Klebsiella quasipneumoniae subsp. similipneumoniae]